MRHFDLRPGSAAAPAAWRRALRALERREDACGALMPQRGDPVPGGDSSLRSTSRILSTLGLVSWLHIGGPVQ